MSVEAMAYVLNLDVGDPTRKLILLGFANHAHADGTSAFPATKTLARYANCSERTIQRHVSWLIEHGFMREGDQRFARSVARDKRSIPISYEVAMSADTAAAWELEFSEEGRRNRFSEAGTRGAQEHWRRRRAQLSDGDGLGGDNLTPPARSSSGDGSWLGGDTAMSAPGATNDLLGGDTAMSAEPSLRNRPIEPSFTSGSLPETSSPPENTLASDLGDQPPGADQAPFATSPDGSSEKPKRRREDPVWDTVLAVCGINPADVTADSRGAYNRAVSTLKKAGAEPDEIRRRAGIYVAKWPDASLTPTALARRWAEIARANGNGTRTAYTNDSWGPPESWRKQRDLTDEELDQIMPLPSRRAPQ